MNSLIEMANPLFEVVWLEAGYKWFSVLDCGSKKYVLASRPIGLEDTRARISLKQPESATNILQ